MYTHTSAAVVTQQQQQHRVWTYHVSFQESVLADVRLALAKEMSDSQPELQGFSFSYINPSLLCYNMHSYSNQHGNSAG